MKKKEINESKDVEKEEIVDKEDDTKEESDSEEKEDKISDKNILNKIWKVIRIILLAITSPIWFPWKVLFVRRKGRKYNDVDTKTRVFRILRSPITKPLKFCVYLFIIGVEFLLIYKVSNSFISVPFKKNTVQNYYLKDDKLIDYNEEFKKSFDYIDKWNLSARSKMYTFYDSKVVKSVFENLSPVTIEHFLTRFNNDKEFRDNVESAVGNSDKLVSRVVNEYKDRINAGPYQGTFNTIVNATSYVVDFHLLFDMIDTFLEYIPENDLNELYKLEPKMVDAMFEACFNYNNGQSLEEAVNNANQKYGVVKKED